MQDNEDAPEMVSVDISAIENQKENIQPLASGRSAAQLTSLFQTKPSDPHLVSGFRTETNKGLSNAFNPIALAENLRSGHQRFQKDIARLEKAELGKWDDLDSDERERAQELMRDPLEIYVEYIRWIIESYPSGGTTAESKLIPILERSTRKFVTNERYQQDLRYLKLWIYYAHQVQREAARTIFSFLLHKKIGTESSLLYDEFSLVLCHFRDYEKAKYVLQLGIDRNASPIEKLSTRLEDVQRKLSASLNHPPSSTEGSSNPISKPKQGLAKKPVKGKMKVFEDGVSDQTSIPGQITRWDDIGTVESNRKQNTVEPTTWKGQKLPMKATTSSGAAAHRPAKMKVFEDTESDPLPTLNVSSKVAGTLGGHVGLGNPSGQLDGSVEQCDYELLKSNPFRHHKSWSDKNMRML
ncbi:Mad3/BUB1 homology region 1-domain-containing protein [Melampsora americana]|nr:Mad3/BUB1 homology region 1-domain-containing protein [Melampsora americana]